MPLWFCDTKENMITIMIKIHGFLQPLKHTHSVHYNFLAPYQIFMRLNSTYKKHFFSVILVLNDICIFNQDDKILSSASETKYLLYFFFLLGFYVLIS